MHTEPWKATPASTLFELIGVYRVVCCNRKHPLLEMLTGVGHTHTVLYIGTAEDPQVTALIEADSRNHGVLAAFAARPVADAAVLAECAHTPPQQLPATCN